MKTKVDDYFLFESTSTPIAPTTVFGLLGPFNSFGQPKQLPVCEATTKTNPLIHIHAVNTLTQLF